MEVKIWGSTVRRELLLQKINLLGMLGTVREGPKEYKLVSKDNAQHQLTIQQESEVVSNLAFLSYRRKESESITAICLEEDKDGQGMVIRFSVNAGDVSYIQNGLAQMCAMLEKIASRGRTETHDLERFFHKIISLDFERISTRLREGRRSKAALTTMMRIQQVLQKDLIAPNEDINVTPFREKLGFLLEQYHKFRSLSDLEQNSTTLEMTRRIVMLSYEIYHSSLFTGALKTIKTRKNMNITAFEDVLCKLGYYYKASQELVLAARRKRYGVFHKIRVKYFQIKVPQEIKSPSESGEILPLINNLADSPDGPNLTARFQGSIDNANVRLLQHLNKSRSDVKVHAEIKLLFYYETHETNSRPRVICANKSACYLCDLFFQIHGLFQISRTHGRLYDRWILPDWRSDIPKSNLPTLKRTIEEFDKILNLQISRVLKGVMRQPDPIESAVGISAKWSDTSVPNTVSVPITYKRGQNGLKVKATELVSKTFDDPTAKGSIKSIIPQQPHLTSSVVILSPYSSESSLSFKFEQLEPGRELRKQLTGNDRSFVMTFHEMTLVLSFNARPNHAGEGDKGIGVEIRFLESHQQPCITNGNSNLISMDSIHSSGVTLGVSEGLETIFYVCWKQSRVSIQYYLG